jgi:3-oxoacyl-[acyl-carrier protein] reductase
MSRNRIDGENSNRYASISKELPGRSIKINAVAPGPTAIDLFLHRESEMLIGQFSKRNPLERSSVQLVIASAAAFLDGPDSSRIDAQAV